MVSHGAEHQADAVAFSSRQLRYHAIMDRSPLLTGQGLSGPGGTPVFFQEVAGVIRDVAAVAARQGVQAVLCGGMAMQLYGYVRAAKDIEFIAEQPVDERKIGTISFGGDVYAVRCGTIDTTVAWILREDERKVIYDAAVQAGRVIDGIRVITPEWLVIVEIAANRTKDEEDINYLFPQPQLVDRELVRKHYRQLFNGASFGYLDHFDNLCLFADFSRARDQRGT